LTRPGQTLLARSFLRTLGTLAVAFLAACAASDSSADADRDPAEVREEIAAVFSALSSSEDPDTVPQDVVAHLEALTDAPKSRGITQLDSLWQKRTIRVGWESLSSRFSKQRAWVRDSITNTWERHSGLRFVGWGKADAKTDVRIVVADDHPRVMKFGRHLKGLPNGLILNFTFRNFNKGRPSAIPGMSAQEFFIRSIAVHEFGHVLGFHHEQNRRDKELYKKIDRVVRPKLACMDDDIQDANERSAGDFYLGRWDPQSCMNYGNRKYNNHGQLSRGDREALASIYPFSSRVYPVGGTWQGGSEEKKGNQRFKIVAVLNLRERRSKRLKGHFVAVLSTRSPQDRLALDWRLEVSVRGTTHNGTLFLKPKLEKVEVDSLHRGKRLKLLWTLRGKVFTQDGRKKSRAEWKQARSRFSNTLSRLVGRVDPKTKGKSLSLQADLDAKQHLTIDMKRID
jgi:hypothetical protein